MLDRRGLLINLVFLVFLSAVVSSCFVYGWDQSWYYKSFPANETNFVRVHYMTILVTGTTFFLILDSLSDTPFFKSIIFSGLIPLAGLATFGAFWHVGWMGSVPNMKPDFWAMYAMICLLTVVWLNLKWKIFEFKAIPIFVSLVGLVMNFGAWMLFTRNTNFYAYLLLYEKGLASNPHTLQFFALKLAILILWVPLVVVKRKTKK